MPRQARQKGEFSTYHIIQRGNERKNIFLSEQDKYKFLEIVVRMKCKYNFLLYAFCLMDNHTHLLINDNGNDISQIMKSMNISYAGYFNQTYRRTGHLFQDRFKSELVLNDNYLLEASRYIHNNPVKAGIISNPFYYKWSSCSRYMGKVTNINEMVETKEILGCFSKNIDNAIKQYVDFVSAKNQLEIKIMDIEEESPEVITMEQAHNRLKDLAQTQGLEMDSLIKNKSIRDGLIKKIREDSSLTLKQIGALFGGLSEARVSRIVSK